MNKANILLFGEGGSGKSTSIATLFKLLPKYPDLKVRYLMTESNALSGMVDGLRIHKIELQPNQLHYMVARPKFNPKYTSKNMASDFKNNFMDKSENEALKVTIGAGDRAQHEEFYNVLLGMAEFKGIDYVTKETTNLGDYLKWDDNTIFVFDSITAAIDYLVSVVKGSRISTTQKDYMDVQNNFMSKLIVPLTEHASCSVIALGHPHLGEDQTVKQPKDEDAKILKLYPYTFGQALNNKISSKFQETIYAYTGRKDGEYYWAGRKEGVACSTRKVPKKDMLEPDFSKYPIFEE